jgi:triphosphatase
MVRDFAALSPDARHRLRILIKRQRYAAEFFKALQPGGKGKTYLQALVAAQDSLGRIHDADVASTLLLALTGVHDQRVAGFVKGWLAHSAVRALEPRVERTLAKRG